MESFDDVSFLKIQSYSDHPEVYRMADLIVDAYVSGKKRVHRQKYIYPARKLIASLWLHPSDFFRFSTSEDHFGVKRKQVWMDHRVLTLFRHMRDMDPPMFSLVKKAVPPALSLDGKGRAAVYCRSWHFRNTLKDLKTEDVYPDLELPRITLKSDDGLWLPIPEEEKSQDWYLETGRILQEHTELLLKSDLKLEDGSPVPVNDYIYYRRFKGSTKVTGRLYAGLINYPKTKRLGISFAGIPAMSIDLTALHPVLLLRIFYGLEKETAGLLSGDKDPYSMPWYPHLPRAVHKQAINTLLNAKSEESAIRSLNCMYFWYDVDEDGYVVEVYGSKKKREGIKAFPRNSPEIRQYIKVYKAHHPLFVDLINRGAGNALQKIDSDIMLKVLDLSAQASIPVLPVHDELVFPSPHLEEVKRLLERAFRSILRDLGSFGSLSTSISYKLEKNIVKNQGYLDLKDRTNF